MGPGGPADDPRAPYARIAVAALIRRQDEPPNEERWLLIHRDQPTDAWDPPGGRMEKNENLAGAVSREVAEETGLQIEVGGPCYALLTVYKGERVLVVSMACRPLGNADQVSLDPEAASDWRWISTDEWGRMAGVGTTTWSLRDVRRATRMAGVLWQTEER